MSMLILGVMVLGSLIYIFYTVFTYMDQSAPFADRIWGLQVGVEQKTARLAEYQHRVEVLQEELPATRNAVARLGQWIGLLKQQKSQIDAERRQRTKAGARGEALMQMLAKRRSKGGRP